MYARHFSHLIEMLEAHQRGEITYTDIMGEMLAMEAEQCAATPELFDEPMREQPPSGV